MLKISNNNIIIAGNPEKERGVKRARGGMVKALFLF
jgi:hypothetical protein